MSRQFDERRLDIAEQDLRTQVLIPLLTQMGFHDVIEYHGTVEKGKDIICRFRDLTGDHRYVGVVVKSGDIHGAVGKAGNASEVLNQVQQTFDEAYTDIFGLKEVIIDECWVVTSGEIKGSALESIRGRLKKSNLDKLTRFFDHRKLSYLIDRFLPSYWATDRTLSRMVHEFQSPLVLIMGIADRIAMIAERDQPLDRQFLKTAAEDLTTTARLMRRMIEVSMNLSMTRITPRFQAVDLNKIVHQVLHDLAHLTMRRKEFASVSFAPSSRAPVCQCDPSMISLAVWNLAQNAARYGDRQRPGLVAIKDQGESFAIEVTDSGIGVPDDEVANIMRPFFRGTNAVMLSVGGSGVGLSVVQRIAAEHGGTLVLQSNSNPTVFTLTLPKKRAEKRGSTSRSARET